MRNIVVVTKEDVSLGMLKDYVINQGGYWNDEPTLNQGVIEEGNKAIYLEIDSDFDLDYEPNELVKLSQKIGSQPKSIIDIHISNTEKSDELAEKIAENIIEKWGGLVDRE